MSAINFPDPSQSPWTNSSTGITYTYSNGVWKALSSEETFLKTTDAESTYLKQADANFVSLSDGGTQQVISGGGGLNVDGDVQKKGNTVPSAVMGATAPSNPGICDFWTDTSGDTPVLKSWNGTEWVEVGSSGASEFAPVISNVTLTENDTTGDRFTSQTFDVDITMLREGEPFSQKGLKGEVTASFAQYPATESITTNTVTSATDHQTGTRKTNSGYGISPPVWAPLNPTSWGYVWPFWSNNDNQVKLQGSDNLNAWNNNGASLIYSIQASNHDKNTVRGEYFPPNENHSYGYLFFWGNTQRSYVNDAMRFRFDETNGWDNYNIIPYNLGISQDTDKQYYIFTKENKVIRTYDFANIEASTANYVWSKHSSDPSGMVGVGNGYAVIFYTNTSNFRVMTARVPLNFSEGTSYESYEYVGSEGTGRRPYAVGFAAGYFWIILQERNVYRSYDGASWTNLGALPIPNGALCQSIEVDKETGNPLFFSIYSGNNYISTTSNGGGSFQNLLVGGDDGGVQAHYGSIQGDKLTFVNDTVLRYWDWNVQTITLAGTGEDYASFNVGDSVRPVGDSDPNHIGVIRDISGTNIGVVSPYVYQTGDKIEGINATSSGVSSRYLVIDATGAVSGTVGSDPGYVEIGPNTSKTLTFPATFPSGNAPDAELPAGTTFKVSAQATNSIGSSEFGPSNIITPA